MDDVLGVEVVGVGDRHSTEFDWAIAHRLCVQFLAARIPERTRNARPHPKPRVRRIDEGVRGLLGDVALDHLELHTPASAGGQVSSSADRPKPLQPEFAMASVLEHESDLA